MYISKRQCTRQKKRQSDKKRDNLTRDVTIRQKKRQLDKRRDNQTKEETIRQK